MLIMLNDIMNNLYKDQMMPNLQSDNFDSSRVHNIVVGDSEVLHPGESQTVVFLWNLNVKHYFMCSYKSYKSTALKHYY